MLLTYRLVCAYFTKKVNEMVRRHYIQEAHQVDVRGIV
jgi:hypothetical protein